MKRTAVERSKRIMKASQETKPTSNFVSTNLAESREQVPNSESNGQQHEATRCLPGAPQPIIPSGNESRHEFFNKAWLHYMALLVKNERLIIEGKRGFIKSSFIELLHNQIDISNKLFMLISQADEESFSSYKAFIRETVFPSKSPNPTSLNTVEPSKVDEANYSQDEATSILAFPSRSDAIPKEPLFSEHAFEVMQSICNRHGPAEGEKPALKSSLVSLEQQQQLNNDNDKLDLFDEEESMSNHGSIFRGVQFMNFEPPKVTENFNGVSIKSLTNLDDLDLYKEGHQDQEVLASQSQNNF